MYFVVPVTGTYVLRVAECWQWAQDPEAQCAAPETKEFNSYELQAITVDPARFESIVGETEPNDEAAAANEVEYGKGDAGAYYYSDIIGGFASATDVDVYAFSVPADTPVTQGDPSPTSGHGLGPNGNGSTTRGRMYLVDPLDPTVRWAEVDTRSASACRCRGSGPSLPAWVEHQGETTAQTTSSGASLWRRVQPGESRRLQRRLVGGRVAVALRQRRRDVHFFVDGDIVAAGWTSITSPSRRLQRPT